MNDNNIFEGVVGSYEFQMVDENTIEIWTSDDLEFPFGFIRLEDGEIKTLVDFQKEISYWFLRNMN